MSQKAADISIPDLFVGYDIGPFYDEMCEAPGRPRSHYRQLFELANIVVASRPGPGDDDPMRLLPVAIKDDFCYDERSLKLRHKSGCELVFIHDTRFDISSTRIRDLAARSEPISEYVSAPVIDYINRFNLYRKNERQAT